MSITVDLPFRPNQLVKLGEHGLVAPIDEVKIAADMTPQFLVNGTWYPAAKLSGSSFTGFVNSLIENHARGFATTTETTASERKLAMTFVSLVGQGMFATSEAMQIAQRIQGVVEKQRPGTFVCMSAEPEVPKSLAEKTAEALDKLKAVAV